MARHGKSGRSAKSSRRCIVRGTVIHTPSGPRPVEQIRVGDKVWGFDTNRKEPVVTKVLVADPVKLTDTVKLGDLHLTADHPIYVQGQWKPVGRIKPDDLLLSLNLTEQPAGHLEVVPGEVYGYEITVEPPENYFAGGVLVHNKQID